MLEWMGQWEENLVYFCPYTGEYGSMKDRILAYFMQWVSLRYHIVKGLKGSSYIDFNGGYILHRGGYILHPTDVVNINCVSASFSPVKYIWSWGNIRKGMKVQFGKY